MSSNASKRKPMPSLKSDRQAEEFVDSADLSEFDLSGFKPMRFEVQNKSAALNLRLPQNLLDAIKAKAKSKGIPYTRYIRMLIEHDIAQ
ncbi:hypothetical protein W822_04995 [Advenella kashmirensis W13003]|uniref:Uncharacterized protein n=1 Tax=Advenella kashmirensis W13003 TaxID=1424334 RepID=V8QX54_9BURK|nr:BrnA antitoxin family protein [Advenella kashmirensis]ETF04501.1 hypothetical protein W822_04995 [Advenella kashmirensis W13003]